MTRFPVSHVTLLGAADYGGYGQIAIGQFALTLLISLQVAKTVLIPPIPPEGP